MKAIKEFFMSIWYTITEPFRSGPIRVERAGKFTDESGFGVFLRKYLRYILYAILALAVLTLLYFILSGKIQLPSFVSSRESIQAPAEQLESEGKCFIRETQTKRLYVAFDCMKESYGSLIGTILVFLAGFIAGTQAGIFYERRKTE